MVSWLVKGVAVKCVSCGHEDVLIFSVLDRFKEAAFKIKGSAKCPKCGGKMKRDPSRVIRF